MKAIRFTNKQQSRSYTIFTFLAIIVSILLFLNLDVHFNKALAYLLIAGLSFFSILSDIKKAGKEFEEIIIVDDSLKFYFQNKMKDPVVVSRSKILFKEMDEVLFVYLISSNKLIGKAYKNKLEDAKNWNELLNMI